MASRKNYSGFNDIIVTVPSDTLSVEVIDVNNNSYEIMLSRALDGGNATYDLSGVVVEGFTDTEKSLSLGGLTGYTTNKLFTEFKHSDPAVTSYAHNAVYQINKEDFFSDNTSRFLMLKTEYCVYDGFPFDITVFNGKSNIGDFNNDFSWKTPPAPVNQQDFFVDKANASTNLTVKIGSLTGTLVENVGVIHATRNNLYPTTLIALVNTFSLTLTKCCLTDTPFYIRWINHIGGYEFYMFQLRVRSEQRIKEVFTVQTPIRQRTVSGNTVTSETVNLSATNVVTVGQDNLSREDFEWLSGIALSPNICIYDVDAKKWTTIAITEENTQFWDTNNALGTVEYTFTMPRVLTQF